MTASRSWPWIAPIILYAASALEMIIMVTPFAAYFYSVYTPLFHGLEQNAITAWLPQFFLPHLAHTRLPLFRLINWGGALLALVGLVGFFACAIQLYYGKFVKKRLVTGGLYGRVRHPQYLMLIIGGAGFLLLWPRFFILLTYLMMLGLYYILARHEEETILQRYGDATEAYLARVPMLNPFARRRRSGKVKPVPRARALAIWVALLAVGLGLAFGVRTVAVTQLYAVHWRSPNVTGLAFRPMSAEAIGSTMESVLETPAVRDLLARDPAMALLMQINKGSSQLTHLLIDLGMTADARRALAVPQDGYFVVVSQVVARDSSAQTPPGAFSLRARVKPLLLVGPPAVEGALTVRTLQQDQFYPDFARILF